MSQNRIARSNGRGYFDFPSTEHRCRCFSGAHELRPVVKDVVTSAVKTGWSRVRIPSSPTLWGRSSVDRAPTYHFRLSSGRLNCPCCRVATKWPRSHGHGYFVPKSEPRPLPMFLGVSYCPFVGRKRECDGTIEQKERGAYARRRARCRKLDAVSGTASDRDVVSALGEAILCERCRHCRSCSGFGGTG